VAVALREATNNASGGSSTDAAAIVSASAQVGDLAVVFISTKATVTITTTPSGWAYELGSAAAGVGGTNLRQWVCSKVLVSGDINATHTWVLSASQGWVTSIVIVSGQHATTPIDTAKAAGTYSGSATAIDAPAITTLADDSWVLNCWATRVSSGGNPPTPSLPGTHTDTPGATGAGGSASSVRHRIARLTTPGAAGSYGPYNSTFTTAGAMAVSVGIQPAAGAAEVAPSKPLILQQAVNRSYTY